MPQPLLSIVTPSLDQGRFIGQCLESVAAEMATPCARRFGVEHIVMDGGSTDSTVELLENAGHLAYWQSEPDHGQSAAINRGLLHHATGRYATWLNADDWLEPGALGVMLERLAEQDAPDVLVGRCRFVEDGRTIFSPRPPEPIDMASLLRLRTKWFAGELIVQPEAFFSRELFERIGGLNEDNHYTMDHEMWLRMLEAGARFESVDHPVACMRVHEAQKTADNRRIVQSLIHFGRPFLDRNAEQMGTAGQSARSEIHDLERKVRLSEPLLRRLALPWTEQETIDGQAGQEAAPPGFHLGPLRAVLSSVPRWRAFWPRPYRALVYGQPPRSELPISLRAQKASMVDVALFWHALSTRQDPESVVLEACEALRPGGLMIAAAELGPCDSGLRTYCEGLRRLVDQQLSQDHDWLIGPAAMRWVESLQETTGRDDDAWRAAHPHPCGVEVAMLMENAGLKRVASMSYGGMSWHPLTPFAAIEGVPGRDSDAWICGVWQKPG
ncbi:hypothetical protein AY599_18550 [Leptolyngbya valderiana BDU 20041]|nr:hypothetical protein AY599_18550 [Leptolyngbya valderiana BDU 20041]